MGITDYGKQLRRNRVQLENPLDKIQNFLHEAKKPRGEEFENIICVAYNMKSLGQSKEQAIKSADTKWDDEKYNDWLGVGDKIVQNSFPSPSGTMKHFGSGNAELNPKWNSYFIQTTGKPAGRTTKTPKTDMYIGGQRISLKKYGGSQLMSGGQAETLATLAAAYDNLPAKTKSSALDKSWNDLTKRIEKDFIKFKLPAGKRIGDYKSAINAGVDDDLTNFVKDALERQTEMTKALQDLLSTPEVNREVVREAMTGNQKFKDPLPIASHILKFDEDGKSNYIEIDNKYVDYVASQTSFNISFKTGGTGKGAWTATKAIFKEAYEYAHKECLQEALFDRVVKGVKSGVNFLKNIVKKMLDFIWKKVKSLLVSSIGKVLEILGLRIDVTNGDPKVNF
jgi:hypothetical protein